MHEPTKRCRFRKDRLSHRHSERNNRKPPAADRRRQHSAFPETRNGHEAEGLRCLDSGIAEPSDDRAAGASMLRHFGRNGARGNFEVLGGLDCFDPRLRTNRDHFERGPGDTARFIREPKGHLRIRVGIDDNQSATRYLHFVSGVRASQ